jgi:hypothetical protein
MSWFDTAKKAEKGAFFYAYQVRVMAASELGQYSNQRCLYLRESPARQPYSLYGRKPMVDLYEQAKD